MAGNNSSQGPSQTIQSTAFDPSTLNAINGQASALVNSGQQYAQTAQNAAGQYNTNFSQYTPNLNSNFSQYAPQLNTNFQQANLGAQPLDALSQSAVSLGTQGLNNQAASQSANIANQFRGNQGLAGVLQAQGNMQAGLQSNPLLSQALSNQVGRQATQVGLNQQGQSLSNQALIDQGSQAANYQNLSNQTQLSQQQGAANIQGLGNAALAQQTQLAAQPFQTNQSLLSALGSLGQLTGTTTSTSTPLTPQRSTVNKIFDPLGLGPQF